MRFFSGLLLTLTLLATPALAQPNAGPADFSHLFDRTAPAVLTVAPTPQQAAESSAKPLPAFSGFAIGQDGLILTSAAAVEIGGQTVTVTTANGKSFKAEVVGSDQKTGLGLVRAQEASRLPVLPWARSKTLDVGQWVVALGRPKPQRPTLSAGVVSSPAGRRVKAELDLGAQNAGGPVIDAAGEVIGIAAIVPSDGAVPNTTVISTERAQKVVRELTSKVAQVAQNEGKPPRLGVSVQAISPALAQAFGLQPGVGVLVAGIESGTPAAKVGLQPGDVITHFAGQEVNSPRDLRKLVQQAPTSHAVPLTIRRGTETRTATVSLGESAGQAPSKQNNEQQQAQNPAGPRLGVRIATLDKRLAEQLGIRQIDQGAVVVSVLKGSLAASAGVQPGDVIVGLDGKDIGSAQDLMTALKSALNDNKTDVLRVWRDGGYVFLPLTAGTQESSNRSAAH